MKFSNLQKFILRKVYGACKDKLLRQEFNDFYKNKKKTPKKELKVKIITQSLERLIDKGLVIGWGHKTQEKFFIDSIKLTNLGRRQARDLLGRQVPLPFKKKRATKRK